MVKAEPFSLEDYVKQGKHRKGCPPYLKVRELDVLMCIVPGPLGLGLTYREASKFLNIALDTVWRVTKGLKKKYPEAWERIQSMRRVMEQQRIGIHSPRSLDGLIASIGEEGLHDIMADDNFELEESHEETTE